MMKKRYEKNMTALSAEDGLSLIKKRVCVIGCGGLGGYVIEMLARTGVGSITAVDPDRFSESNLNRQLFCTEDNLGVLKVIAARDRVQAVNSNVAFYPVAEALDDRNALEILSGHDVVVDGLDNVDGRLILARHCESLSIPLVHGATGGWYGQVTTILPGDQSMELIYQETVDNEPDQDTEGGNLSFAVAATASIQCGEVIKLLTKKGNLLSKRLLKLDLLNHDSMTLDLS